MGEVLEDAPTTEELEALLVNNPALARLERYLGRFNPIRVMRMERMEIRHSAILAWLLDPQESHGLDDKFLKAFLGETLRGRSAMGFPDAIDITRCDLRDTVVRREWQNIDIFIHNERNGWAFVVENKYESSQHEGQLTGYIRKVQAQLGSNLAVHGIFLTLYDEEPADTNYAPINYEAICAILPQFLDQEAHLLTGEVATFLRHYIEIIEEKVGVNGQSGDMKKLARQLYRENRKVLDFIMEHGAVSDFSNAVEHVFGDEANAVEPVTIEGVQYRLNYYDQIRVGFLPESWFKGQGGSGARWPGCENWGAGYPLDIWMHLAPADGTSGRLTMYAAIGPLSDCKVRKELVRSVEQVGQDLTGGKIGFTKRALTEGTQSSKFFRNNSIPVSNIHDIDEVAAAMKVLLKRFQPELDAIGAILPPFAKYGQHTA